MADTTKPVSNKALIKRKYKEFLPEGVDPERVYIQWTKSVFGNAKPDDSIMYFILSQAKAAGIDARVPRQIYAVPYNTFNKTTNQWEQRFTIIIGIEGMVTIAERTGQYGGVQELKYEFGEDENGKPDYTKVIACTCTITKIVQGIANLSTQQVFFDEYFVEGKTNAQGKHTPSMWETKPKTMLKKVALAHALRASFSACAALYVAEEMERGEVIEGQVVGSTPDIEGDIKAAKTGDELQAILENLKPEEKLRAVPLMQERMREIETQ